MMVHAQTSRLLIVNLDVHNNLFKTLHSRFLVGRRTHTALNPHHGDNRIVDELLETRSQIRNALKHNLFPANVEEARYRTPIDVIDLVHALLNTFDAPKLEELKVLPVMRIQNWSKQDLLRRPVACTLLELEQAVVPNPEL